jgi:hypothetical protein
VTVEGLVLFSELSHMCVCKYHMAVNFMVDELCMSVESLMLIFFLCECNCKRTSSSSQNISYVCDVYLKYKMN